MGALFNVHQFDLCCPACGYESRANASNEPSLKECPGCRAFLVIEPEIKTKANAVLLQFHVKSVERSVVKKAAEDVAAKFFEKMRAVS